MKVLQINAVYGKKSTGVIVRDIHLMLKNAGHESRVACPTVPSDNYDLIRIGTGLDYKIHALLSRLFGNQGFHSKRATRRFLGELDKNTPDIIHLHNVHSNFLNLPELFAYTRKRNIPVVLTLHDAWFFTGKCYHFLDCGCERWKSECKNCPKRMADIPSILTDSSQKVFRKKAQMYSENEIYVVGCSKWISDMARLSPLFNNSRVYQIYNGADAEIFNPNAKNLHAELELNGCFTVLTMANKWFDKKNEKICRAVLNWLGDDGRLIILGCTQEQKESCKDLKNVICQGYISDRGYLARMYTTADVFLNLTLVDTLPTVNIEAALCGIPIITYDSGGSGELVLNGETGFVVEPLNESGVIEALDAVRCGRIERKACADWGLSSFKKEYNYKKYLELYEMIDRKRGVLNG